MQYQQAVVEPQLLENRLLRQGRKGYLLGHCLHAIAKDFARIADFAAEKTCESWLSRAWSDIERTINFEIAQNRF